MTGKPLALYVHWPFCLSKCPYCDFNSHVRETIDQDRWRAALLGDLEAAAAAGGRRALTSIFFGGGTPSLMAARTAGAIIERAARLWSVTPDTEITLEANPTSVEAGRLADYRAAGVNRVSLGVQALDDAALRFLGRGHSAAEAVRAVEAAARIFDRFSFDLIYGRPGQTAGAWRAELAQALALADDHLSLYQLTLEPRTAFFRRAQAGEALILDEDGTAALYELTQSLLADAGMPAYEISNHAKPGRECRHNLVYWRYGDYLGVGPGAHGRHTAEGAKVATRRIRSPEDWLGALESGQGALAEETRLDARERFTELMMMGLRLAEGVPMARIRAVCGEGAETWIDRGKLRDLVDEGYLDPAAGVLRATVAGRQRLDAVLAHLLA
ncbi:MAG: coproporphyrinogen III oxidase [Alphaproteobacteria bacterium]|nr:coproporphyrinogen III oxidase [Alphaproteobacteria bacterium]